MNNIKNKFCKKCFKIKDINTFLYYNKNNFCCLDCKKKIDKEYNIKNKEKINNSSKNYRENNRELLNKKQKIYYQNNKKERKEYSLKYEKQRLKIDINYKLAKILRSRLRVALKSFKLKKVSSSVTELGCSIEFIINYLESKFYDHPLTKEKMTWNNHSRNGWHIDHIVPLKKFNLEIYEEFKIANHYTNLRPMWAEYNISKGAR